MAKIIIDKDDYGFPYYICSDCGQEAETEDDYYCEACGEEFKSVDETLTDCEIVFIKNINDFSFCQLQKNMRFGDRVFPMTTELEFYVFPRKYNFSTSSKFKINFKEFSILNIQGYSVYYNPNHFSQEEILEIKTYRFS